MQPHGLFQKVVLSAKTAIIALLFLIPLLASSPQVTLANENFTTFGPSTDGREAVSPMPVTEMSLIPDIDGQDTPRVSNGGMHGELPSVSSAVMTRDGVEAVRPNDFGQTVAKMAIGEVDLPPAHASFPGNVGVPLVS